MFSIKKTSDYNRFKIMSNNRKINKAHVNSIMETLKDRPRLLALNPILVNEEFEIIDGQHRFEAIKKLSESTDNHFDVYYIQGENLGIEEVQALNATSKNWTPLDFALSYADMGEIDYLIYLDFKNEYKLNHDILMQYLSLGEPMTTSAFKQGDFMVTDKEKSHQLCKDLIEIGQTFGETYKHRSFALAFMKIWLHPEYSQKRMVNKMKQFKHTIPACRTPKEYLRALEDLYNYYAKGETLIRFY